jgi:Fe-S oxidoreductase
MPWLEHGDLAGAQEALDAIVPQLEPLVDAGWDIVAPVPSCVLMLKREYGMIAPEDGRVARVAERVFDPFEYLWHRYQEGKLNLGFAGGLGRIAYHAPCHQRVQNIGPKTRQVLELIPDTEVSAHERCSGHDGTWGVKVEWFESSMKIGRPLFRQVNEAEPDYYASDCPIAGNQIRQGAGREAPPAHPLSLLRRAYGLAGETEEG